MMTATPHDMENPIIGHPFSVILIDDGCFMVKVVERAQTFDSACGIVDDLPNEQIPKAMIVHDTELVRTLVEERRKQAARMEAAFGFAKYGFNRAWSIPPRD